MTLSSAANPGSHWILPHFIQDVDANQGLHMSAYGDMLCEQKVCRVNSTVTLQYAVLALFVRYDLAYCTWSACSLRSCILSSASIGICSFCIPHLTLFLWHTMTVYAVDYYQIPNWVSQIKSGLLLANVMYSPDSYDALCLCFHKTGISKCRQSSQHLYI